MILGTTDVERQDYYRLLGWVHRRYGIDHLCQRPRRARIVRAEAARRRRARMPAADADIASAIVSLACYHGGVPLRSLLAPRAPHWTRPVRAAAAWLLRDRFALSLAAIADRLATTPRTVQALLALAAELRGTDRGFVTLTDRVRADLTEQAA